MSRASEKPSLDDLIHHFLPIIAFVAYRDDIYSDDLKIDRDGRKIIFAKPPLELPTFSGICFRELHLIHQQVFVLEALQHL
jgi:hypothetical protein